MPSLIVVEGKAKGLVLPLREPIVSIGRDDTCTFQLLDEAVSRKHLQVKLDPKTGGHIAGDYRSANGVFVNELQITLDTPLNNGDVIRIGQTSLVYLVDDSAEGQAALAAARKKGEWKRSTIMRRA